VFDAGQNVYSSIFHLDIARRLFNAVKHLRLALHLEGKLRHGRLRFVDVKRASFSLSLHQKVNYSVKSFIVSSTESFLQRMDDLTFFLLEGRILLIFAENTISEISV
jgi:hypothetical protein